MAFIFLNISYCSATQAEQSKVINICHEANHYPPYIFQNDEKPAGLLAEIVMGAASSIKENVVLYSASWLRCQKDVKSGYAQALFAMIKTEERDLEYAFPIESEVKDLYLWRAQYPIFIRSDSSIEVSTYQPELGLGAPIGYVVWQILNDKQWLSPFTYNPKEGLETTIKGKLDGYVVESLIGSHILHEMEMTGKLKKTTQNLLTTNWYLPFNTEFYKNNKNRVNAFWKAISQHRTHIEQQNTK